MGLRDLFRRRHDSEKAIPDPESPEFQQQVAGSELPGSSGAVGVESDQWKSVDIAHPEGGGVLDLRGSGAREEVVAALKRHGVDPDQKGQTINTSATPELQQEILEILKKRGLDLGGGSGG
jgi:hypothetical protein